MTFSELGRTIAGKREALGISREELAGRLGIKPKTVEKWEAGKKAPRFRQLAPLGQALGVPAEELLPGEDRMETLEEGSAVARDIAALPPRYRELILLKHWQGYSDREIAALLGMAQGNVARTLQRAKEKLRKALKDEGVEV